ncbi:hypothetical protein DL98DRAFT_514180 [Cadophora sp. DSE1049]|nr:hypothetical protein DL98DRAFT_514180 [Cadophora sp. DSE1049]
MLFFDTATASAAAAACLPTPKPPSSPSYTSHSLALQPYSSITHHVYPVTIARSPVLLLGLKARRPVRACLAANDVASGWQTLPYLAPCRLSATLLPSTCSTQVSSMDGRHGSCRSKIAQVGSTPINYAMRFEAVDEKRRAASESAWRWHWLALALGCCISSVNCKSWRMSDCSFLLLAR